MPIGGRRLRDWVALSRYPAEIMAGAGWHGHGLYDAAVAANHGAVRSIIRSGGPIETP